MIAHATYKTNLALVTLDLPSFARPITTFISHHFQVCLIPFLEDTESFVIADHLLLVPVVAGKGHELDESDADRSRLGKFNK